MGFVVLFLILGEKFQSLTTKFDITMNFSCMVFIMLRKFSFNSCLLTGFYFKRCNQHL